jgi:hypothetical protein
MRHESGPIIRLEVESMKHTMLYHLMQYSAQMDETLQKAVENFCTPENLETIIMNETSKVLDRVIREEVSRWFVHGEGRAAIKAAVEKRLRDKRTYTQLDFDE